MKHTFLLASVLCITACTPTYDDLNQWMKETRKQAKSQTIPFEAPTVTPPAAYNPPAYSGLNAFDPRRLESAPKGGNAPNPNRRKEVLESFSLDSLRYVGNLSSNGRISGFVQADSHVYTVAPGNYIGQNHGRIQSITEDKIILTELIEDSYGNWVHRKAELPLSSPSDKNGAAMPVPNSAAPANPPEQAPAVANHAAPVPN
ncbi:pilus assembly protein PilP [Neisseria perflava]|uniref:pilus assembly protein PilP n=1 Tax=Neisseria perflava TaxID=33053 RepID=UPI00209DCF27|nr:pilus assembly protein PilP [Neisseria perflava]